MSSGKRYFWLKLKEDFFSSKRIKKLRNMAGGDTYLIIYLKLQLKAMKQDGIIRFDHLEQNIADELALDLDENPDDVAATLIYLTSCGLAESSDNEQFYFPYAVENVGSESSAAERMRKMRERNNVTPLLRDSYGEIEKEIEIDTDTEIEKENVNSEPVKPASEPDPPEAAVYRIILNDKSYFDVTKSMIDQFQELYPAVNVDQEIRKMVGWSESNPTKRKTKRGAKAFINNWLSREQDKGPKRNPQQRGGTIDFTQVLKGD